MNTYESDDIKYQLKEIEASLYQIKRRINIIENFVDMHTREVRSDETKEGHA